GEGGGVGSGASRGRSPGSSRGSPQSRPSSSRRRPRPPSRAAPHAPAREARARFPPRCKPAPGRRDGSAPTSRPGLSQGSGDTSRRWHPWAHCLDGRRPRPLSPPGSLGARVITGAFSALVLAVVVAGGVGCLTADGTLEADGSATLSLSYSVPPGTTEVSQRYVLQAPGVTVESLTVAPDHVVSAR